MPGAVGRPGDFGRPFDFGQQGIETIDGDNVALEPDSARSGRNSPRHQVSGARTLDHGVQIRRLPQRLDAVPRVGDQHRIGA